MLSCKTRVIMLTINKIRDYIKETLGFDLKFEDWKPKGLPIFLLNLYFFYRIEILGKKFLLLIAHEKDAITPAMVRKHLSQLSEKMGVPCIYASSAIASYNLKRLVAQKVQFIVPHRQLYLPALGIDWVEHCQACQVSRATRKSLSPAAQTATIYVLLHHGEKEFIP